jgi:hypothetical protein
MQLTKLVSFFLFTLTFGLLTFAGPITNEGSTELAKRADNSDIKTVLDTLKGKTDTILPQIGNDCALYISYPLYLHGTFF